MAQNYYHSHTNRNTISIGIIKMSMTLLITLFIVPVLSMDNSIEKSNKVLLSPETSTSISEENDTITNLKRKNSIGSDGDIVVESDLKK